MEDLIADINVRDQNKHHALHKAAYGGYLNIIEFLLNHPKIDMNPKANNELTPLHIAAL